MKIKGGKKIAKSTRFFRGSGPRATWRAGNRFRAYVSDAGAKIKKTLRIKK